MAQRLLDRELTAEELTTHARIQEVFHRRGANASVRAAVREIAQDDPGSFFAAALAVLESAPDPRRYPHLYATLLDCPQFLIELMRPDRYRRDQLLEACRNFIKMDTRLDIRLARLVPGRSEDRHQLDTAHIVRILDILNEISPGPKLVLIMNHLTGHPDSRVASKAILLMGRRIQNSHWVDRHASSDDPRKRASVVEALWGHRSAWCRQTLWKAIRDENNRVVGNALVGLHLLGDSRVRDLVRCMLQDPRVPFRYTAAWVMSKMGDLEFLEPLRAALADPDQQVRQAARRALVTIRRPIVRQQQLEMIALSEAVQAGAAAAMSPEPPPAAPETPLPNGRPAEPAREPAEEKAVEYPEFNLHLDGTFKSRR